MRYTIDVSKPALADLLEIYEYISQQLQSPENAQRQIERIEKRIASLSDMPARFSRYNSEPWRSRGMRNVYVDNYCMLYDVNDIDRIVTILRIIYGGRDIESQLDNT